MSKGVSLRLSSVEQLLLSRNRKVARQSWRWGRAGVWIMIIMAAGFIFSSMVWAWANFQQITLNYQISRAQETQKQLLDLRRQLRVEHSALTSISRLERLAVEEYGMGPPQPHQVVHLP